MTKKFMILGFLLMTFGCSAGSDAYFAPSYNGPDICTHYIREELASESVVCNADQSTTCGFSADDKPMALKDSGNAPGFVCNCIKTEEHHVDSGVYSCIVLN